MLYPYKCEKCGESLDVEIAFTEEHPKLVECPVCKEPTMKRVWGASTIHIPENFKATGDSAPWDSQYGKFPKGTKGKYF